MTIKLRRREDGAYPITLEQFKSMYPNAAMANESEMIQAFNRQGFDIVYQSQPPESSVLDTAKELAPVFNIDKQRYEQVWILDSIAHTLPQDVVDKIVAEARVVACNELKANRLKAEEAGVMREGKFVPTDERTFNRATSTVLALQLDPELSYSWETPIGGWVTVDLSFMTTLFKIMNSHRQRCLSLERRVYDQIMKANHPRDMTELVKSVVWPD